MWGGGKRTLGLATGVERHGRNELLCGGEEGRQLSSATCWDSVSRKSSTTFSKATFRQGLREGVPHLQAKSKIDIHGPPVLLGVGTLTLTVFPV